ncbi:MAG: hypothetical protein L3K06_02865 [Thermoplasmata archaeon]|nr:hypothetical protein [Thermoplasmata archaeon]
MAAPTARSSTVAERVARDEELLRIAAPSVQVSVIRDRGVSFGVGSARDGASERAARAHGLATARRSTGGTGVLHLPGDLAWSIVLPRGHALVGRDFSSAYGRLGTGVVMFLADLGIDGRWDDPLGISREYCLLGFRGRVLTVGGRALGGAAQHVTATALLHHGVVSRSLDRPCVRDVFGLSEEDAVERLTSLTDLGIATDPDRLAEDLERAIAGSVGLRGPI